MSLHTDFTFRSALTDIALIFAKFLLLFFNNFFFLLCLCPCRSSSFLFVHFPLFFPLSPNFFPQRRIKMIFNTIIRPSRQKFRNFSSSVSQNFMLSTQNFFFLKRPAVLLDIGVQMVMPTLSVLLSSTVVDSVLLRELLANHCPTFQSVLHN